MFLLLPAALCAGLFAGAAVYVTLVEHPARLARGPALALRQFGPSYRRATVMQASLAVVGCLAAVVAGVRTGEPLILAGGALLGAIVPFTLLVLLPTNRRLLSATDHEVDSGEAGALLVRWGRLHAVRSVVSLLAFGLIVGCLAAR